MSIHKNLKKGFTQHNECMHDRTNHVLQFEEIYISYYSRMKRFAREYVLLEEDAENIVQDLFSELWEKKIYFTSFANQKGFLFVMLKNRCIDFLRRKTIEKSIIDELQEEYLHNLKMNFGSLEALDNKFLLDPNIDIIIRNAIDGLPEKCRKIFIMNRIDGKKQKTISEELNISINTIESQMAIAYKKLKEKLKDYLPLYILFFS